MMGNDSIQIVEIDVDYCSLNYGSGACSAVLGTTGAAKCFNTFATCQDEANFDRSTLTLRFGMNQEGLPIGQTIFPALQKVTTNPLRVNISDVDSDLTPLGRSERVTVTLKDFVYSDVLTDKYNGERTTGAALASGEGYDPRANGTFFGRLKARSPYYFGRPLRVLTGTTGQDLSAMQTRHYVIDEFIGPDASGAVKIVAKDALGLIGKDTALVPSISPGKARSNESGVVNSFLLDPPGIGSAYPSSGFGTINGRLIDFTRSGDEITVGAGSAPEGAIADAFARALSGNTIGQGDRFQLSYVVEDKTLSQAIGDVLRDFANIPSAQIDQTAWEAETTAWSPSLRVTGIITEPTPVADVVAEFCQLGGVVWADTLNQRIEYKTIRDPVAAEISPLSDEQSFLEGSISVKDRSDLRLSQVGFFYDRISSLGSISEPENFRRVIVSADLPAEGENEYNKSQFKNFFTRFVEADNETALEGVANAILARHVRTPVDMTFDVDVKDRDAVGVMSAIEVTTRLISGADGVPIPTKMQVKQVEEVSPNSRLRVTAQSYS